MRWSVLVAIYIRVFQAPRPSQILLTFFFQTAFGPVEHDYEVSKNFIDDYPTFSEHFPNIFRAFSEPTFKKKLTLVTGGRLVHYT